MTSTATSDVRGRREQLGLSRLRVAIASNVSPAWLAAIEAGLQPVGSRALARVEAALDAYEAEHETGPEAA